MWKWYILLACAKCLISRCILHNTLPIANIHIKSIAKANILSNILEKLQNFRQIVGFCNRFYMYVCNGQSTVQNAFGNEKFCTSQQIILFPHMKNLWQIFIILHHFNICKSLHSAWNKTLSKFSILPNWKSF